MGRGSRGGRWTGAGRRRAPRTSRDEGGAGAEIIVLTWAQTFGRGAHSPKPDAGREPGEDGPGRVVVLGEGKPGS